MMFILGFFLATAGLAADDYFHCKRFVEEKNLYRSFGFAIADNGEFSVDRKKAPNFSLKNGVYTYPLGDQEFLRVSTVQRKLARIERVRTSQLPDTRAGEGGKQTTTESISFIQKNGVCIPARAFKVDILDYKAAGTGQRQMEEQSELLWGTEYCREIYDFFRDNPEAKKCQCGNDSTTAALEKVIRRHEGDIEMPSRDGSSQALGAALRYLNPTMGKAWQALNSCDTAGLAAVLTDERVWRSPAPSSSPATGGDGDSQEKKAL